ncbi:MAG TPA: histidinol-phosphate transaminase [Candidatus Omnitrophota bacterium]|nr:histidinol-phosphate transaminase [Candidatus Omnitrophota bacterium]HRZ15068.1 histidinol-phosphate transaminase [Candidatus Omnitrophota bacterium]
MELVRKNIRSVEAYVAGKPIEETKRELGLSSVIKLASNENPFGPSPKALAAMKKAIGEVNRYPDSQSFYLKKKLALALRIKPENIVLGNGSDELIDILIKTFVEDDETILTSENTFVEYAIIARINNKKLLTVPLKDFRYDLAALKRKITAKTKLVFIANPNNPTGTYVGKKAFDAFLSGLPRTTIIVLDEAYDTFIDVKDYPRGIAYLGKKNVIAMKTFSKAYGLAGARVGYAIADARWTPYLERTRQPFNINLVAQAAAQAALDDTAFLARIRRETLKGKRFLYDSCTALGLPYVPSVTNFVLIDVKRDCREVFKALLKQGVIVRDMKQYHLDTFIRVTIGTEAENKRFVRTLTRIIGRQHSR